ncbi:hypothetical protein GCM10023149_26700 [Mucilaginibacter gynuensis]|uniref:F0F1-ATPase subunit (Ca2+/Mg2+ transporter) n=1 Tax=Mucilaginibacter gynuensis TaxID=1302236 RepID=A0ABP8GI83_9SPHI
MAQNEQKGGDNLNKAAGGYAKYTGLAVQMMVIIGGFAYAGYKIDQANNHKVQWVTAVLALAGVFISLFLVIKAVKN